MNKAAAIVFSCLMLQACGQEGSEPPPLADDTGAGARLEAAAIDAGLIPAPADIAVSGRFEHLGDVGTDKFCAIQAGAGAARVGLLAVFGPDSKCEARGTAQWQGETVKLELTGADTCQFTARFDGVALQLPGKMPEGCDSYCSPRATFAGVVFYLVETGDLAARSSRGRDFDRLCE